MAEGRILSAGIDYISASIKATDPSAVSWMGRIVEYQESIASEGVEIKPAARMGYSGLSVGSVFCGSREDGYFVQISGERAQNGFAVVYSDRAHFSRLDVQCTVATSDGSPLTAINAHESVRKANETISKARQRDAMLIQSIGKGSTCYVGSRKSPQFGRIYDKYAESKSEDYKNAWRYEIEFHNILATETAKRFARTEYAQSVESAILVKQWYTKRHISTPWSTAAALYALPSVPKHDQAVEDKLRWLEEQVAPAIRRLLKLGLRDSIIEVLGLDGDL
jgi:hypothetical protein